MALKRGGKGCLVRTADEEIRVPVYAGANCIDTTGAGDNFAAAFIAGVLEGKTLAECGAQANAVASICVESLGAATARLEKAEIRRRYERILSEM